MTMGSISLRRMR